MTTSRGRPQRRCPGITAPPTTYQKACGFHAGPGTDSSATPVLATVELAPLGRLSMMTAVRRFRVPPALAAIAVTAIYGTVNVGVPIALSTLGPNGGAWTGTSVRCRVGRVRARDPSIPRSPRPALTPSIPADLRNCTLNSSDATGGTMPEEFGGDLAGAVFWGADLSGARFRDVNLTDAKISHAWLVNVDIDALVDTVVINGVDVTAYVNARDPWYPLRAMLRP